IDATMAAGVVELAAAGDGKGDDVRQMAALFDQLLVGWDARRDLLPRLGSQVGAMWLGGGSLTQPRWLATASVDDDSPRRQGVRSLADSLENALQPLLVLTAFDHNQRKGDVMAAGLKTIGAVRFHYLSGGRSQPAWLQPGFAVAGGWFVAASNPTAFAAWWTPAKEPPGGRSPIQTVRAGQPADFLPLAFVDFKRLAAEIERDDAALTALLEEGADAGEKEKRRKVYALVKAVVGAFDRLVVGRRGANGVSHWTASLFFQE
ncbi:MAG: hypothetical protein ACRC1K_10260, partial [Planctomycetia bacterium]